MDTAASMFSPAVNCWLLRRTAIPDPRLRGSSPLLRSVLVLCASHSRKAQHRIGEWKTALHELHAEVTVSILTLSDSFTGFMKPPVTWDERRHVRHKYWLYCSFLKAQFCILESNHVAPNTHTHTHLPAMEGANVHHHSAQTSCWYSTLPFIKIFIMLPDPCPPTSGGLPLPPSPEVSWWHVSQWCVVEVWDYIVPVIKRCMLWGSWTAGWGQSHYLK